MTARTNIMSPFSTWCWSPFCLSWCWQPPPSPSPPSTFPLLCQHHPLQPTPNQGCGLPLHAGHNDRGGSQRQRQPPRRAWKVQTNNLKWMIVKLTWSKMSLNKTWENILWARLPSSRSKLGKTGYSFVSRFVMIQLFFAAKWILISEVTFESGQFFSWASNKTSRFHALPTWNISVLRNVINSVRS